MDKNINGGHRVRLLQRYLNNGISSLEEHEMLELLLHFGIPYRDTKQQAKLLISQFGGIENVFGASASEIENSKVPYITERVAALITLVCDIQKYVAEKDRIERTHLRNHDDAGKFALSLLDNAVIEKFYIVNLSAKNKILYTELISEGTGRSVEIMMNKIINSVVAHKASRVLLMHNHPGGKTNPSLEDITQTGYIEQRLNELDITLADHVIVADGKYISMRNRGFIY